jgi:hypothetical protein
MSMGVRWSRRIESRRLRGAVPCPARDSISPRWDNRVLCLIKRCSCVHIRTAPTQGQSCFYRFRSTAITVYVLLLPRYAYMFSSVFYRLESDDFRMSNAEMVVHSSALNENTILPPQTDAATARILYSALRRRARASVPRSGRDACRNMGVRWIRAARREPTLAWLSPERQLKTRR